MTVLKSNLRNMKHLLLRVKLMNVGLIFYVSIERLYEDFHIQWKILLKCFLILISMKAIAEIIQSMRITEQ